ncbi:hypothetical protein K0M31_001353 [Melipona bicolor]|uniref:Uncharacterized protein n=1 Tax=Melipona bicolor TaxID=60889 RepID=A0AA40KY41_9HYME|nr:hypothetical protein K0M31_001353 [Melipona bicolor]
MLASASETDLIEVYAIAPVAPVALVPRRLSSPGVLKSPATSDTDTTINNRNISSGSTGSSSSLTTA